MIVNYAAAEDGFVRAAHVAILAGELSSPSL